MFQFESWDVFVFFLNSIIKIIASMKISCQKYLDKLSLANAVFLAWRKPMKPFLAHKIQLV